jgi:hypothetical protein
LRSSFLESGLGSLRMIHLPVNCLLLPDSFFILI